MKGMLHNSIGINLGNEEGVITAEVANPAVSCTMLKDIWKWKGEGCYERYAT